MYCVAQEAVHVVGKKSQLYVRSKNHDSVAWGPLGDNRAGGRLHSL